MKQVASVAAITILGLFIASQLRVKNTDVSDLEQGEELESFKSNKEFKSIKFSKNLENQNVQDEPYVPNKKRVDGFKEIDQIEEVSSSGTSGSNGNAVGYSPYQTIYDEAEDPENSRSIPRYVRGSLNGNNNQNSDQKNTTNNPSNLPFAGGGFFGTTTGTTSNGTTITPIEKNLTCSSSVTGGSFGNPISVKLSCSSSAQIKYCLSEGGCCDPQLTSTTFTSDIVIGSTNGNYCLSFYGVSSEISKTSTITQHSYLISNTLPDLNVTFPKAQYQTTNLSSSTFSSVTSSDFGKNAYIMGQVNLNSRDPGLTGENLSCEQIVKNYNTFANPVANLLLNPMDMSIYSPTHIQQVPFQKSALSYGLTGNFITTFITNSSFAAPLYSCSNNNLVLYDFPYFNGSDVTFGDRGTNDNREFEGGLSSYGFFEDPDSNQQLNRTPAGSNVSLRSGNELHFGHLSIIYE